MNTQEGTLIEQRLALLKRAVGLILAAVILVAAVFVPETGELSRAGIMSLAILFACISLWFCGTMPNGAVGIAGSIALLVSGAIPSFSEAFSGYVSTTTWFILAVFFLTAIMVKSSLGQRLTCFLIKLSKGNSSRLILAFMGGSALISTVMTDTGAVVVSMSLALPLLKQIGAKPLHSNLGKCILLGIAFAAVLGGFATPFGHSLNILGIGLLETQTGAGVGVFQWLCVGVPVAVIMIPVCWFFLIKAFPPEAIEGIRSENLLQEKGIQTWTALDIKSAIVLVVMPLLWIAGNWVPLLHPTTVAVVMLVVMFVPKIDVLSWKEFQDAVSWDIVLMIGGIMSLGNAVQQTGGGQFIANIFLDSGILNLEPFLALLIVGYVMYFIHTFCPIAPALCLLFLPPLIMYCETVGLPGAMAVMIMASITAGNFLVPLNPTITVTYGEGYYLFGDVAKAGWVSALIYVPVVVAITYFIGNLVF